jgi:integrase
MRKTRHRFTIRGFDTIYRNPFLQDGKWRVRRRRVGSTALECITLRAGNLTEAREEVARLAELERQEGPAPKAETVAAAVDSWMATVDVRPVTRRDYDSCATLFKAVLGPDRIVSEVTLEDIEALFFKKWSALKGQTKVKYRMILARIWKHAIRHGMAKVNFPLMIEVPKKWRDEIRQARHTAGQALTFEEAQKLLRAARDPYKVDHTPRGRRSAEDVLTDYTPPEWLWHFIFISLRTGLRRSNVLGSEDKGGLRWKHLDLEKKVIKIDAAEMKNGMDLCLPVHDELVAELKKLLATLGRVPKAEERVVPGFAEGVNVAKIFRAALVRSGLDPDLRPHDLRHSFASWVGETCPEAVTKRLLHHAALDITDRYSRHQRMDALRKGLNSLPPLLAAPPAPSATAPAVSA